MSSKEKLEHDDLDSLNEALSRSELFILKNQKTILAVIGVIVLILAIIIGLRYFYFIPRENTAQSEMAQGTFYFQADSFKLAVAGDGADFIGFEALADKYSSTDAGNLAKAYAGISYFRLGEYDKAISLLSGFDADDLLVAPAIIGLIGDCYVESDKTKEGISFFEKAASRADNEVISPIYLKKAGIAYESLNENEKALKAYQTIKDKYSSSVDAMDIDKYIERASRKK